MSALLRGLVAATFAAGSWVGLHPEQVAAARAAAGALAETSRAAPAPPVRAEEPPPRPPHVDTSSAPAPRAWPRLNPEADMQKAWRLAEGPHRRPGDNRKLVTLTFDDGPFPETTPKVLELLADYEVRATFFAVGRYLDGDSERAVASREVLRDVVAAGHIVGNHTHDHALLTTLSQTEVLEQIDRGASSIERAIGRRPVFFRPPYGQLDAFGQAAVRERRLDVLLWNVEAQDMERDDTQAMFRELTRQIARNRGGVVLLHDIRWTSVHTLEKLLAYLDLRRYDPEHPEREGYAIVDLPAYLREVEASPPRPRERASSAGPREASSEGPRERASSEEPRPREASGARGPSAQRKDAPRRLNRR